jgi:hypothetical protein
MYSTFRLSQGKVEETHSINPLNLLGFAGYGKNLGNVFGSALEHPNPAHMATTQRRIHFLAFQSAFRGASASSNFFMIKVSALHSSTTAVNRYAI